MENNEKTQAVVDYWKDRFEFGEMPEIIADFNTEEHLRILYYRIQALEKKSKDFEKALRFIIPFFIVLIILSAIIIPSVIK
jgi:predicted AAA+ superfamily ATPase